jgi:hypothetical protein
VLLVVPEVRKNEKAPARGLFVLSSVCDPKSVVAKLVGAKRKSRFCGALHQIPSRASPQDPGDSITTIPFLSLPKRSQVQVVKR